MNHNANFNQRAVVHAAQIPWQASPMAGVDRRMLDRIGGEVARATSIVRYAPGSHFSPHVHAGGEEFFVLDGVFQDEHGDFPAGSYVRNPPQSSHTPGSELGCIIFVKLWQFDLNDRTPVRLDTNILPFVADPSNDSISVMLLYKDKTEDVSLEQWSPDAAIDLNAEKGLEILVLNGSFVESGESFFQHSWLRTPKQSQLKVTVGHDGARVWIKRDHLALSPQAPIANE